MSNPLDNAGVVLELVTAVADYDCDLLDVETTVLTASILSDAAHNDDALAATLFMTIRAQSVVTATVRIKFDAANTAAWVAGTARGVRQLWRLKCRNAWVGTVPAQAISATIVDQPVTSNAVAYVLVFLALADFTPDTSAAGQAPAGFEFITGQDGQVLDGIDGQDFLGELK